MLPAGSWVRSGPAERQCLVFQQGQPWLFSVPAVFPPPYRSLPSATPTCLGDKAFEASPPPGIAPWNKRAHSAISVYSFLLHEDPLLAQPIKIVRTFQALVRQGSVQHPQGVPPLLPIPGLFLWTLFINLGVDEDMGKGLWEQDLGGGWDS